MTARSLGRLDAFLAGLPRLPLGHFPTPLVPLLRAGQDLGLDLWMKRDELSGVALGGNKTRKLEYILADARANGYGTIVTTGPVTSNHTMMTAAACRRAELAVHCVVAGARPAQISGNLLLLDYLGAQLHFCPMNFSDPTPEEIEALKRLCREVVADTGGYWVPAGGTMPAAEPGYMGAVAEIARQQDGAFSFDHVVLAMGTGSTTTGVLLGLALAGIRADVHAVMVTSRRAYELFRRPPVEELFDESAAALGLDLRASDCPAHELLFGFAEEGYGVPNAASDEAIRYLARREGYFLDPVYTAKAFAGLLALARSGRFGPGSRVLFIHTGGLSMTPAAEKRWNSGPTHNSQLITHNSK